jgi:hypothetical protein
MSSRRTPRVQPAAALIVTLMLATLGCAPLPLEPDFATIAGTGRGAPAAATTGPGDLSSTTPTILPEDPIGVIDPIVSTRIVAGAEGATLTAAGISLELPPGAFDGSAEIKVIIPDSTKLHCYLEISGSVPNHFDVPVLLTFDCRNVTDIDHQGVFWFNPATGRWVQIAGDIDRVRKTVTTPLSHFSEYKCEPAKQSKASW